MKEWDDFRDVNWGNRDSYGYCIYCLRNKKTLKKFHREDKFKIDLSKSTIHIKRCPTCNCFFFGIIQSIYCSKKCYPNFPPLKKERTSETNLIFQENLIVARNNYLKNPKNITPKEACISLNCKVAVEYWRLKKDKTSKEIFNNGIILIKKLQNNKGIGKRINPNSLCASIFIFLSNEPIKNGVFLFGGVDWQIREYLKLFKSKDYIQKKCL
jgi:hypothetical protein